MPHWTLDAVVRRFKWVDDGLEKLGRRFLPGQATSLYLLLIKMNASFRVIGRREVGREDWDAFADASDDAWLWHRYDLQDALETWPGSTDESFALMAANEDQALALVPLRRITKRVAGLLPVYVLESLGGVAVRNGLGEKRRRAVLMAVRDQLVARVRKGICLEARISLPAMAPAMRGAASPRVNPLLELGCSNTLTQTWVVDLRGGREAVWKQWKDARARPCARPKKPE